MNAPEYLEHNTRRDFGDAWLVLCIILGAHVYDEAITDFLGFFNPFNEQMRQRYGAWPMPTFEPAAKNNS